MLKIAFVFTLALALSGCMTPIATLAVTCTEMGYQTGTLDHVQCVERRHQEEIRMLTVGAMPPTSVR